ncbi:MAG: hypothetical protein IKL58_00335 [Phascolarctobacterium sp.]|nr:hypothetical protein [Phascolarctobacterium sp.]
MEPVNINEILEKAKVLEPKPRKTLNRDACYKTGLQVLAAGTRKYKAAKKHIDKLGNEEFNKELNRLIYEQEKFHKEVARALRQEQRK